MAKRRRKEASAEGEAGAAAEKSEADVKLDEGLKTFEHAMSVKTRVKRKIEGFKKRGKITPGSIRQLLKGIIASLD